MSTSNHHFRPTHGAAWIVEEMFDGLLFLEYDIRGRSATLRAEVVAVPSTARGYVYEQASGTVL